MTVLSRKLARMDGYETLLAALGLTPKEARVYLSLLKEGPSSVRQLAAATGINRGTVYDILKELQAHGLARFYNAETRQYFVAAPPEYLETIAQRKADELARASAALSDIVPQLQVLYDGGDRPPVARMFEGPEGVRSILEDVLASSAQEKEKEYFIYSSSAVRDAGFYSAFPDYTKERLALGIRVKNLSMGQGGPLAELAERKTMNITAGSPTYTLVYAGKVAYIFLDRRGEFVGLIMENRPMFDTQKFLFLELWNRLTS